jgi:DNA recombination protein RmuC
MINGKNTESGRINSEFKKVEQFLRNEFDAVRNNFNKELSNNRVEMINLLKGNDEKMLLSQNNINAVLNKNRMELSSNLKSFEEKIEKIRDTVEKKLDLIRTENIKKLEEMRATVDEKLQSTLEKRIGESFKQVSERLEQVYKGLGEMQTLASGVGDLKKVLSNVKTRGILGEIQLENILENILSCDQYQKNVRIKKGMAETVEFAIKLPGKDDIGSVVYLPIDSKFPIETYTKLLDAYDTGDPAGIKVASKLVENEIKRCARDIKEKYINVPDTTDFGILFLPVEGLYAEVVRQTNLIESLQKDYKIIITGPTTLAALLNSLQIGFRTLAIEKRTSEVWNILSAVKTEFNKFGDVLKKAQEKITKANEDIDELVGVRTKKIQYSLKKIEELPDSQAKNLLNINEDDLDEYQ